MTESALITGGAGSIGSEVARRFAPTHRVTVLDINEEALWSLKCELPQIDVVLGDVRSIADMQAACRDVDAVIHCAAMKHVHLCERSPRLAKDVNTIGSAVTMMASARVRRKVFLSTDKAMNPTTVLGRTKAEAESTLRDGSWNVVRFGNVLGTRGSLLPAIMRYRALGRPIQITDPDMTRFFMPISEAVELIEWAVREGNGIVFSPERPRSARIGEFVEVCRDLLAPDHPIEIVGARPGERMHEWIDGDARSDDPRFLMDRAEIETMLEASGLLVGAVA